MIPWSIDETVFLVKHYPTMPVKEISAHLSDFGVAFRSVFAIHHRARYLGINKENAGELSRKNQPPTQERPAPLRALIVRLLTTRNEITIKQVREETGALTASIWKVLSDLRAQGNAHIARYQWVTPNAAEAVYVAGFGRDADKPWRERKKPEPIHYETHETQPIPRPTLGPWGLCWNNTTSGEAANTQELVI